MMAREWADWHEALRLRMVILLWQTHPGIKWENLASGHRKDICRKAVVELEKERMEAK